MSFDIVSAQDDEVRLLAVNGRNNFIKAFCIVGGDVKICSINKFNAGEFRRVQRIANGFQRVRFIKAVCQQDTDIIIPKIKRRRIKFCIVYSCVVKLV